MFDLIVFDLDGTLIDTAPEIADAVNAMLSQQGMATVQAAQVRGWIGHGTTELLLHALSASSGRHEAALRTEGIVDRLMPAFSAHYLGHCGRNSKPYPGVENALDELRTFGARRAIVTNKVERFAYAVLDAHHLRD